MKHVLFVGMDPSHQGDPDTPLEGAIGLRLANLLNISRACFVHTFDRINLNYLPRERFDKEEAEGRVRKILHGRRYSRIILLGKVVSEAFGLGTYEPLTIRTVNRKQFLLLPHPSGLNRWWNEPANRLRAGAALRRFLYISGL